MTFKKLAVYIGLTIGAAGIGTYYWLNDNSIPLKPETTFVSKKEKSYSETPQQATPTPSQEQTKNIVDEPEINIEKVIYGSQHEKLLDSIKKLR